MSWYYTQPIEKDPPSSIIIRELDQHTISAAKIPCCENIDFDEEDAYNLNEQIEGD
jgi:hypothetical protein